MIQQKAVELLFALKPAKRTLQDLERGIEQASNAQKLFAALAADPAQSVPYSKDIADQRKKYGDSLMRKADDHLSAQRQHEAEQAARMEAARQRRHEEKERLEAIEVSVNPRSCLGDDSDNCGVCSERKPSVLRRRPRHCG